MNDTWRVGLSNVSLFSTLMTKLNGAVVQIEMSQFGTLICVSSLSGQSISMEIRYPPHFIMVVAANNDFECHRNALGFPEFIYPRAMMPMHYDHAVKSKAGFKFRIAYRPTYNFESARLDFPSG